MFAEHIYYPLVKALRHRPDETAVSVAGKTCDNRHFAMLIAPIMNELDTFSEDTVALLLEDIRLFATPWAVACQAPLSMGILQEKILEWVALPSSRGSS